MERDEMKTLGQRLLAEARALRAAFPDAAALAALPVSPLVLNAKAVRPVGAALGYLHDEMLVVQGGRAGTLVVLDDEMANVEHLLSRV